MRLFGVSAIALALVGCQAVLDFDPSGASSARDAGNESGGGLDAGLVSGNDSGALATTCGRRPSAEHCADFDSEPKGFKAWVPFAGGAAVVEPTGGPSGSGSLLVDVTQGDVSKEGARAAWVAESVDARPLKCEVAWKVEGRPVSGAADIIVFEFVAAGQPLFVVSLVEGRDGSLALFTSDVGRHDARSTHQMGSWKRGELLFDRTQVTLGVDGQPLESGPVPIPPYDSIRIFIGAYAVQSAPWKVRFDDAFCERQ